MGTIATHKPREFQKYRLRDSPLWGEKVAKIGHFSDRKSPNMAAKFDSNRYRGSSLRGEKTENISFLSVMKAGGKVTETSKNCAQCTLLHIVYNRYCNCLTSGQSNLTTATSNPRDKSELQFNVMFPGKDVVSTVRNTECLLTAGSRTWKRRRARHVVADLREGNVD